jgi:microcompartment protein CcmK/EutM
MKLCRVLKQVISTIKHPALDQRRLYWVQPVDPEGHLAGEPFVSIDVVKSSLGSLVLVNSEGGGSQEILGLKNAPVQSVIVGIVKDVSMTDEGKP